MIAERGIDTIEQAGAERERIDGRPVTGPAAPPACPPGRAANAAATCQPGRLPPASAAGLGQAGGDQGAGQPRQQHAVRA